MRAHSRSSLAADPLRSGTDWRWAVGSPSGRKRHDHPHGYGPRRGPTRPPVKPAAPLDAPRDAATESRSPERSFEIESRGGYARTVVGRVAYLDDEAQTYMVLTSAGTLVRVPLPDITSSHDVSARVSGLIARAKIGRD
jgi:hypothetical protein